MYIIVDMIQEKSRQLFVHLLLCILIARGAKVEPKQMQQFLEFVDNVNISLHPTH